MGWTPRQGASPLTIQTAVSAAVTTNPFGWMRRRVSPRQGDKGASPLDPDKGYAPWTRTSISMLDHDQQPCWTGQGIVLGCVWAAARIFAAVEM
ncbi:MAG: hypothetical protein GY788_09365 [bacterium]|nr:hypothetical protein [bacterium]